MPCEGRVELLSGQETESDQVVTDATAPSALALEGVMKLSLGDNFAFEELLSQSLLDHVALRGW